MARRVTTLEKERSNGAADARAERGHHISATDAYTRAVARDDRGDATGAAYWLGYAGEVESWEETR